MRGPVSTVTEALQLTHREHSLPRRRLSLPPHEAKLRNRKRKFTLPSGPLVKRPPDLNTVLKDPGLTGQRQVHVLCPPEPGRQSQSESE